MIFNHTLWKPSALPKGRSIFFQQFKEMSFRDLAQMYFGSWQNRLISNLKQGICRVFGAHTVACGIYGMHRRHQIPRQVEESLAGMRERLDHSHK